MPVPKLPNDILISIIKMENRRLCQEEHKKKMSNAVFEHIETYVALDNRIKEMFDRIESSRN